MDNVASSLKRLKFDPKLQNSWVGRYLSNPRLLILIILSTLILGISAFINLPRRLNPEIKIPIVLVSTILPGASPSDIESLVSVPLEDALTGIQDVKTVSSSSTDSVSSIQLEFESGVDPEKARTDTQSAVDTVTLPGDAQSPKVQKLDFENQPVLTFALVTTGDTHSLMRFAKTLEDKLKDVPMVENVSVSGLDEQEIQIVIKPSAISTYAVNPLALSQIVTAALHSFPAGSVRTDTSTFTLSIDPQVSTIDDLRTQRVNLNGNIVLLSQIAEVSQRAKPDQRLSYFATPSSDVSRAVTFQVFKTDSANITTAAKDAEKVIDETLTPYEDVFSTYMVENTGQLIDDQFNELLADFGITIGLIVVVLFIFLGARQAIIAASSVPLTFLISFTTMQLSGISINFLSLFSLLLSLGLLVDDTIVVISAMSAYYRTGKFTPSQTGLLVWRDFVVAIFTTTITTVWAFLPLLLSTGIIGEFIKSIPIVVSSTLLASFFIAMFVTLPLIIILLKPQIPQRVVILGRVLFFVLLLGILLMIIPKGPLFPLEILTIVVFLFVFHIVRVRLIERTKEEYSARTRRYKRYSNVRGYLTGGIISFEIIGARYRRLFDKILGSGKNRRMAITMVIVFSVFSYLLLPLGFVKNEFFPKSDNEYIYLTLELPAGTNVQVSEREAKKILSSLRTTEGSIFSTADIGRSFAQGGAGVTGGSGSNTVLFTLRLYPEEKRHDSSIKIASMLRKQYASYQTGKLSVVEVSGGPPAGADVQIKLFGDDLKQLDAYAEKVENFLEKQRGITNVNKSIKPGTSKLSFVPDKQKVSGTGLSIDQLGGFLRLYASGVSPDTLKLEENGGDELDVTIRMSQVTAYAESISSLSIPAQQGPVPLFSLGKVELSPNPTLITREDGKRTISISASIVQGVNIGDENKKLEQFANTNLHLPDGYSWKTGGVNEENQRSVNSIFQAMIISFVLIVLTMVLQFSSFRKALIVMLVIPLSISGVFIIFALTQTPLSFPALIGVLALFGIVVKNSILVVDKIKQNVDHGMIFREAVVDGSASRLEAIALTSMTAVIGLIPITLSDPLWRGLGGAIIAGLTFSGTIMLFFIPVVYYYWFQGSEGKNK